MQLEVVSDKAKFAQLKEHWNQLAADQPLHSWEWMFHWWDAFQNLGSLALLVVRDQDRVVGIAPWFIRRTAAGGKQLCFLGSGKTSTDYLRILSTQDCATEVLRLIRQAITEGLPGLPKLDCLELEGISATDQQMSTLIADLQQANFDVFVRRLESTWAVDLPSDWDTFVQSVRKQYRRKIRSALRRMESGEFTFRSTATGEDFDLAIEHLIRLHQNRWEAKGEPGCFADPQFEQFLRTAGQALANRNACEIVWCEYQGTPIVSHIYLTTDKLIQLYQTGLDDEYREFEPGFLLFAHRLRHAIESGRTRFDFLRGDEHYKSFWGAQPHGLLKVRCIPASPVARMRYKALQVARAVKKQPDVWVPFGTDMPEIPATPAG